MIEVEKNIPIPEAIGRGRARKYPFWEMAVGDSFLFGGKPSAITGSLSQYSKKSGQKFTLRTVEGGTRVWRIE